jgi:hypothetical protein
MEKRFYNLINNDINELVIQKDNYFNCVVKDNRGNVYEGFILAKSPTGSAVTVCEITFQKSTKDHKYHPRLIFKRTDEEFREKKVAGESLTQRISFQKGNDGYREFWKMVSFLKRFDELVDTGKFEQEYRVATQKEVLDYLKNKDAYEKIIDELGSDSASSLRFFSTIKLLKSYREQLNNFIENKVSENVVQQWIDEDESKHMQDRCMIFGLEFVDHVREGGASGDRYDLFTRIGPSNEERVLIELKSPGDSVFDVRETPIKNGVKKEYSISRSLSRAIPQILEYRKTLESKPEGDPELQKIGEDSVVRISKCIIVIGSRPRDVRSIKNLREFRKSLSSGLEIWTYTDLLHKINSTIRNLEKKD